MKQSDAISDIVVAINFAALPNPGVWSVTIRSLSTVLGIPIILIPLFLKYSDKSFILKDNLSYSILLIFLTLASPSKLFGIELTSLLLSL